MHLGVDFILEALTREVTRVFAVEVARSEFADRTVEEIRDLLWDPRFALHSGSDDPMWEGSPGAGGSPSSSTVGILELSAR